MTTHGGNDGGFATISAVMLCAGLAVVSVALIDAGFQSIGRARQTVDREVSRQALQSAIAETSAGIVNRHTRSLGSSVWQYGDVRVEVVATNELSKVNIYQASEAQLASSLQGIDGVEASALATRIATARGTASSQNLALDEFLRLLDVSAKARECLRSRLTVHASSIDPLAIGIDRNAALDGGILNLRAHMTGDRAMDLTREEIIVVTGSLSDPLLVLEEHTYRKSQLERCSNDQT